MNATQTAVTFATRRRTTTVQRAYLTRGGVTERTLVSSKGHVYLPERGYWTREVVGEVVKLAGEFRRWVDVPAAWLGEQPWWK